MRGARRGDMEDMFCVVRECKVMELRKIRGQAVTVVRVV